MDASAALRVLLVFSDLTEIRAVKEALSIAESGIDTGLAGSVAEALAALQAAPFDFVVAAVALADGGAGDIAENAPAFPCIAVGTAAETPLLSRALDAGAVDFLYSGVPEWPTKLSVYLHRLRRIRRRLAVELNHSARRYADLVDALPDVVYELDIDGRFTFVNSAVKQLGYNPDELIGKHFSAILFEEDVPHVSRDQVLPLYLKNRTGARNAPKLFDERRGVDRKTENLELRIRRPSGEAAAKELIASVISFGEIAAAGAYREQADQKEKIFVGTVGIIRDITLRRKSEDMLRKMYQAVDQSPVAVAILDRDLIIEYVNPAFFSRTNSSPDYAIGRKIGEFLGESDAIPAYDDLVASVRSGMDWNGELRCPRKDADPYWCSVLLSAVRSPSGALTHFICLMEDITRKRTLDDLLRQAKDSAEDASNAKSEFLATMSHELRTPLAGIVSLAEVLLADRPNPTQEPRLKSIRGNAQSLLSILNDLLDLAKIESRTVTLQHEEFDLAACIADLAEPFRSLAESKGLDFHFAVDVGGFPRISTDQGRLRQIVSNLVSNAVKFTEKGSVDLRFGIRARDDMPALFVSVRDTGIGIAAADQQKLFKHFSRIEDQDAKRPGGTGLGLAIAKELVLKLGGDLTLESTPGAGSTFSFYIPVTPAGETRTAGEEDAPPRATRKMNVLVAEDNPVNRDYLRYFLEKAGHRVELAADGYAVLEALDQGDFDAVLMDIQMPGLDGIAATANIRSYTGSGFDPRIPVVALTAYGNEELGPAFERAEFDAHVSKPVNARSLIALLDEIARRKEYFDIRRLRHQYAASVDDFRRLLLITAQDLPKRSTAFTAAHKAGDFGQAVDALHGVVSILSAIGAVRGQQLIKRYRKSVAEASAERIQETAEQLLQEIGGIKRQVKRTLGEL